MHAPSIIGRMRGRIQTCAEEGAALADDLEEGEATTLPALCGLVVNGPSDGQRDHGEEAHRGGEEGEVADSWGQA